MDTIWADSWWRTVGIFLSLFRLPQGWLLPCQSSPPPPAPAQAPAASRLAGNASFFFPFLWLTFSKPSHHCLAPDTQQQVTHWRLAWQNLGGGVCHQAPQPAWSPAGLAVPGGGDSHTVCSYMLLVVHSFAWVSFCSSVKWG